MKKKLISAFGIGMACLMLFCGCGINNPNQNDDKDDDDDKTVVKPPVDDDPVDDPSDDPIIDDGDPDEEYYAYDYTATHESANRYVTYYSSDARLDTVLNDYTERHMRDTVNKIHSHPVGMGGTAWKEWEAMTGSWWDASAANGTMSAGYATKDIISNWLCTARVDNQGYVWCDDGTLISSWAMGWEFPDYRTGGIGWSEEVIADSRHNPLPWTEWTVEGGTKTVTGNRFVITSGGSERVEIVSPEFGVSTTVAPFLNINFGYTPSSNSNINEVYVYYKTDKSNAWSEDKKVPFSTFCVNGFSVGTGSIPVTGYEFPMYLQEQWGWDYEAYPATQITQIKVVFEGTVDGTISLGHVATDYDDRQSNNVCNYIISAAEVLAYSQDATLLTRVVPTARRAMNFLLNQLGGKSGLISTDYLKGHMTPDVPGTGIGNGYWDVLAFPKVNLYCNISFYNALTSMALLEGMVEHYGITGLPASTTYTETMTGDQYTYAETRESLETLIESCREQIRTYFWNSKTGRFHVGYDDLYNRVVDHGYLMFNEQVLASGIATEEQAKSVMQWINGTRTVSGDDSVGEDIWFFEMAPRFNTADIGTDFYAGQRWNGNVQNGGSALHLAYYDIVAQSVVSKNAAYGRMTAFRDWYEKIMAAGGEGWNFYRAYYNQQTAIKLQGGDSSGTLGVDYEFLEAALVIRAIPSAFFGLSASYDNTLNVSPKLPSDMKFWKMENLTFSGYYYDLSIGQFFAEISGIEDYKSGSGSQDARLQITFKEPAFNYKIYLDGEEYTDYTIQNGTLILNVAFRNTKVEIKESV